MRLNLAVATNCRQTKTGSLARSDRMAKYHQCCGNAGQEVISGSYQQYLVQISNAVGLCRCIAFDGPNEACFHART
jgi:hypothetical protein